MPSFKKQFNSWDCYFYSIWILKNIWLLPFLSPKWSLQWKNTLCCSKWGPHVFMHEQPPPHTHTPNKSGCTWLASLPYALVNHLIRTQAYREALCNNSKGFHWGRRSFSSFIHFAVRKLLTLFSRLRPKAEATILRIVPAECDRPKKKSQTTVFSQIISLVFSRRNPAASLLSTFQASFAVKGFLAVKFHLKLLETFHH